MRIRKNAKLSPLLFTCSSSLLQNGSFSPQNLQTHICQLNQSPWDVIPFVSNSSSSIHQFEDEEDGFKNGDSFGAFDESVASMMETEVVDVDNKPGIETFDMMVFDDNKVVNNNGGSSKGLKRNSNGGGSIEAPRRCRGRPKKSLVGSASGSNSNEFYYYSGFGPSRRKQRKGDCKSEGEDNKSVVELGSTSSDNVKVNVGDNNVVPSVDANVVTCSEGLDCVEDYEDDYDDSGDDNGNRRTRKPVKERSLKSLM
ncbi:hypothetical protein MtrunA17_Chr8g0348581 [Medicago truncatula]|uniref:Uncharacterized protein n=1 Tax=Medicago truncatula TaxID=3880 RepID=A0A396GMD0_MEDTR|nr:uncharacterized protein LOC25500860 [Medicago truncatula]RHN39867.1 hypothetical protein MtrunA17_Chr8g0348581 [Medicago truncatula]